MAGLRLISSRYAAIAKLEADEGIFGMKIVLLPGLDGTGKLFGPLLKATPGSWSPQVVSYPVDKSLTYRECVDFVRGHLPSGEDYLLLGESFSGPVSIALAAEAHANLKGLVLCNTFARRPWWRAFGALPWSSIFARPLPPIIMHRMGASKADSEVRALLRSATSDVQPEVLAYRLRQVLSVDVSDELVAVDVPILYLRGRFDTTVRPWALRYIQSIRPDVVLSEHPVAHLLLQLVPQLAWGAIDTFRAERIAG